MRTLWVFNDFGKGISQRDVLMLLASTKLWSIHCPSDQRVLYCSDNVGNTLSSLGSLKIYDEVILLPQSSRFSIDSSVFWASPKLEVLLRQTEPVTLFDHDFLPLCNLREVLPKDKVVYAYTEDARQYYPGNLDPYLRSLEYQTRWPNVSANVSFLQLPFPEWTEFYAGTSLRIMEELTKLKVPDARYLIFAEQMVLKHLISTLETGYSCLIKNIYQCKVESWTDEIDENGIWTREEAWGKKFIHYGPVKSHWTKQEYEDNIKELCEVSGISLDLIQKTNYLRR